MAKQHLRKTLSIVLCLAMILSLVALPVPVWAAGTDTPTADEPQNTTHQTVAIHDPSIVIAYKGTDGKTYPTSALAGSGAKKVYYVFGTENGAAKSEDLVNWTNFTTNLNNAENLMTMMPNEAKYSRLTVDTVVGNCWAPDVIWNPTMGKWCMYLSVNGQDYNSSIVLLIADDLEGVWSYVGPIVFSGMGRGSNDISCTDFYEITGYQSVPSRYTKTNNENELVYGLNAIDAAAYYDDDGRLWMVYGSWFGGIYMLELDPTTGLRDKTHTYETVILGADGETPVSDPDATVAADGTYTTVYDKYFGIHIAGGHQQSGEGPYIERIGDWYYLFVSYGFYSPTGGYNMRVFRSKEITGPYEDSSGKSAIYASSGSNDTGSTGNRVMSGYRWSWWDFSYVAQGHNSAVVDDDGRAYLVYHNKYMDGTVFHVMKVHELLVNKDGWLVTSPFETTLGVDERATGLKPEDLAGSWGTLFMRKDNGKYGNPVTETVSVIEGTDLKGMTLKNLSAIKTATADATLFNYDSDTGEFSFRIDQYNYKGYFLWQNIEGTNIKTLAFTVSATEPGASMYTYWGYKYPDPETTAKYLFALPTAVGAGSAIGTKPVTGELWGSKVTITQEDSELVITANGTELSKTALGASDGIADYASSGAGKRLMPIKDNISGVSISFDYEGINSDWTPVLSGEHFRINLSTMEYFPGSTPDDIYEGAAAGPGNWTSFFGDGRATIQFNEDGSIAFYRGEDLMLTYAAGTKLNKGTATVGDLCAAVLKEFKAGTVKVAYPLENISLVSLGTVGKEGVFDGTPFVDLKSLGVTTHGTIKGAATNTPIPAIPGVAGDNGSGLSISFMATVPAQTPPASGDDWNAKVITTTDNFIITLPNIDPWWNTSGTVAQGGNFFPTDAEIASNGASWDSFLGKTSFVTVTITADGYIKFYQNGLLLWTYKPDRPSGQKPEVTVESVAKAMLTSIQDNGFTFATGVTASDLIVTSALTDEQANKLYGIYIGVPDFDLSNFDIGWNDAAPAENTNVAWWNGAFGATILPAGNHAVQMKFERTVDLTNDAIQIIKSSDAYGTFYPFGTLTEWPNDWQAGGWVKYYENGNIKYDLSLITGNKPASAGFWSGSFVFTFLRYDTTLYVICDFTRTMDSYNLVAVYTIPNITEDLTVRLSGDCGDITGTVATSKSVKLTGYDFTVPGGITAKEVQYGSSSKAAIGAVDDALTNGVSFTFRTDGVTSQWTKAVGTNLGINIGLPALDPWNNTDSGYANLKGQNWAAPAETCAEFFNSAYVATITVDPDGSIHFYKDGKWIVTYDKDTTIYNDATKLTDGSKVSEVAKAFLKRLSEGTVSMGDIPVKDLVVTKALSGAELVTLMTAYGITVTEEDTKPKTDPGTEPEEPEHNCATDGHNFVDKGVKDPCTGKINFECSYCKVTKTEIILNHAGVVGHKYTIEKQKVDCENTRAATFTCSVCGDSFTAELGEPLGHAWTYTAVGDTIIVICDNDPAHSGSIALRAPEGDTDGNGNLLYTGNAFEATLDNDLPDGIEEPTIVYTKGSETVTTVKEVGTYTASITLGGETASVTFKIVADNYLLKAAIDRAEALDETKYTTASWANMQTVLAAAQKVLDDETATQEEVDKAAEDLDDAVAALVKRGDKTALAAAVKAVDEMGLVEDDYTPDSWAALQTALADAKGVLGDLDATQDDVDDALAALNDALYGLARKDGGVVTAALEAAIAEAEALTEENYTTSTWAALQTALTAAKAALESTDQTVINNAATALQSAISGLLPAADKTALEAVIAEAEALIQANYTEPTRTALQAALAAAQTAFADGDATQEEVDNAVAALQDAIYNLEVTEDAADNYKLTITYGGKTAVWDDELKAYVLALDEGAVLPKDPNDFIVSSDPAAYNNTIIVVDGDAYAYYMVRLKVDPNNWVYCDLIVTVDGEIPSGPVITITGITVDGRKAAKDANGNWSVTLPYGSTYPNPDSDDGRIVVTLNDPDIPASFVIISNAAGTSDANGTYTIFVVGAEAEVTLTITIAPRPATPTPPPSTPSTTDDVTTGSSADDSETTETTAKPGATVTGGTASSSVSDSMGEKIVKQAVENESDIVVIEPNMPDTVTSAEVTIPGSTLSQIGEKTDADVTVKTPAGNVTIPNEALEELGSAGGSVVVSVKAKDSSTVRVEITAGGKSVETVDGGIKAALPIGDGQVAVLVDADGNETVIQKSLVENGTAYVLLDGTATVKIVDKSKDFDDISDGYRFENAVAFVSSHGLFKGVGDGSTFFPGTNMSRAMLVTVLWRLESEAKAGAGAIKFTDIDNSAWYVEGMAWASAEGIVRGTSATTFSPDDDISREQLATMLYRYAGTVGLDTSKRTSLSGYTDGTEVSSWASDAMEWAVAVGLINGKGNSILDAKGETTRIEVAIILQRLVGLLVK